MKILINGEVDSVSCTRLDLLLDELGHPATSVATAVNQEFVPIDQRAQCQLVAGDSIEIIAPMSGG
jgi:sulfur carrier protein